MDHWADTHCNECLQPLNTNNKDIIYHCAYCGVALSKPCWDQFGPAFTQGCVASPVPTEDLEDSPRYLEEGGDEEWEEHEKVVTKDKMETEEHSPWSTPQHHHQGRKKTTRCTTKGVMGKRKKKSHILAPAEQAHAADARRPTTNSQKLQRPQEASVRELGREQLGLRVLGLAYPIGICKHFGVAEYC